MPKHVMFPGPYDNEDPALAGTPVAPYDRIESLEARVAEVESTLSELLALVEQDAEALDTTTDLFVAVTRAKFILGRPTPTGGTE